MGTDDSKVDDSTDAKADDSTDAKADDNSDEAKAGTNEKRATQHKSHQANQQKTARNPNVLTYPQPGEISHHDVEPLHASEDRLRDFETSHHESLELGASGDTDPLREVKALFRSAETECQVKAIKSTDQDNEDQSQPEEVVVMW